MDIDQPNNFSFFDFVGGIQLLQGEETKTALPVILIGICMSGAIGNLLVLLIFIRDFRIGRGSEVKAFLVSLASTDLVMLLLCAPVRAVTYYQQTWIFGRFVCRTTDWFQHSCVIAKTLILAASSRATHNSVHLTSSTAKGPLFSPTWIHGALAFIWILSMIFPIPQMLFASLQPTNDRHHTATVVCVSETPACAADFMNLFYKLYPTAAFVLPIVYTLAYYTKTLHSAVNNHAATGGPQQPGGSQQQQQSKVTLVLLCVSGANALMLLPEWATFTWTRLGYNKPPVGLLIFAQVLLYACSALSPVILMTMYDDVRQGLVDLWFIVICSRHSKHGTTDGGSKCTKSEGSGAEVATCNVPNAVADDDDANNSREAETFPDVEHFWTGRRNTQVENNQDPVPWEREEQESS